MDELISIIVPVYNCQDTIKKCIESIINQTYKKIEIIFVDDGSIDDTTKILKKYMDSDKRIHIISKSNGGVSKARNTGIKNATGKYIMFVDSDDWIEFDMVEKMHSVAKKNSADIVRCNHYINGIKEIEANLYDLSNKLYTSDEIYTKKINDHFIYSKQTIKNFVMLLLINRSILFNNDILFDEDLFMMEDVLFYQQLFFYAKRIFFMGDSLYHYIINEKSETRKSSKFKKNIFGIIETNKKMGKFFEEKNIISIDVRKLNSNHLRLICGYITKICGQYEKKYAYELFHELSENKHFDNMLKECEYGDFNIKDKIEVKCLKKKNKIYKWCIFKCFSILIKIKSVYKK